MRDPVRTLTEDLSTDMNQQLRDDPEKKKFYSAKTMLGRISDPSEQAGSVVFLLSDYATCEWPRGFVTPVRNLTLSRYDRHAAHRGWRSDMLVMDHLARQCIRVSDVLVFVKSYSHLPAPNHADPILMLAVTVAYAVALAFAAASSAALTASSNHLRRTGSSS